MTIDERTKKREQELLKKLEGQRRLARPTDYVYDKAQQQYWDVLDMVLCGCEAVDSSIPLEFWRVSIELMANGKTKEKLIKPSEDIKRVENNQFVEAATWWPGQDRIIKDYFINESGPYRSEGRRLFNQYIAPPELCGNVKNAERWIDLVKTIWPNEIEHNYFFDYCAHMVQKPHIKCNSAIVLSGDFGIGKDSVLEVIKCSIGAYNCKNIDPDQLFSQFRGWLQTLMLVIDEVRPTRDEHQATSFYNTLKPIIAAPPHTLPVNDKFSKLRYIVNLVRVFITTNDWLSMYVPDGDRRYFVMHSQLKRDWHTQCGKPDFFREFHAYLEDGGAIDAATWLQKRDISHFDAKSPPPKTDGWKTIAATWTAPEDYITHILDNLENPDVFFGAELALDEIYGDDAKILMRTPKRFTNRLAQAGYVPMAPQNSERWHYTFAGKKFRSTLVFVKKDYLPGDDFNEILHDRAMHILSRSEKF